MIAICLVRCDYLSPKPVIVITLVVSNRFSSSIAQQNGSGRYNPDDRDVLETHILNSSVSYRMPHCHVSQG